MKSNEKEAFTLNREKLPSHIAIVMDGSGRWAKKRMLNRIKGHEQGSTTVRNIVSTCRELDIPILTLYAFSTENWERPKAEVKALMMLLKRFIVSERREMLDQDIRLHVIGQKERLPEEIKKELYTTLDLTKNNNKMQLNLALSYGSQQEITRAVRNIAKEVASGQIMPEDISMNLISDHLYTKGLKDPDLIIRTSGEYRLSNFLLWQAAYS
ncbi:MAG: di-trans,poly-cis-decaprenylcistransferase, partial [Desulfobacteraceae bacterium]|nr:di-trans,poly-cis-decaprenylcistransferase [Desulfobacteraceae bacterium]